MNIYVVVEGKAELKVYEWWIPLVNPNLSRIHALDELEDNSFYLVSGKGYPYYFNVIEDAISDVNQLGQFHRLVVSADSEDRSREEKHAEISDFIVQRKCRVDSRVVVQHFCFETWALGNRKVIRRFPHSRRLRSYKKLFDVGKRDPELLPAKPDEDWNRSQFANKYLRLSLKDRFRGLTYTKRNPRPLLHDSYFAEVRGRLLDTNHIPSFEAFLEAFA